MQKSRPGGTLHSHHVLKLESLLLITVTVNSVGMSTLRVCSRCQFRTKHASDDIQVLTRFSKLHSEADTRVCWFPCLVQSLKAEEEVKLWHEQQRQAAQQQQAAESVGCFCVPVPFKVFGLRRQSAMVQPGIEDVAPGVLWDAAQKGNLPVVKLLMEKQVDTLVANEEGNTALHMAARGGHIDVIREMVREGGLELVTAKNNFGRTAQDIAEFYQVSAARDELGRSERELRSRQEHQKERERRAEELSNEMTSRYDTSQAESVLRKEEYRDLIYAVLCADPNQGGATAGQDSDRGGKYGVVPKELVCGEFEDAAKGFFRLLVVDEDDVNEKLKLGVKAILDEVAKLRDKVVSDHLEYILYHPASERKYANGVRDKGRKGMRLADFVQHKIAKAAELKEAEVVALRLYTTAAYQARAPPIRVSRRGVTHTLGGCLCLMFLRNRTASERKYANGVRDVPTKQNLRLGPQCDCHDDSCLWMNHLDFLVLIHLLPPQPRPSTDP